MEFNKQDINDSIINIINKKFGLQFDKSLRDVSFFELEGNLSARNAIDIIFCIEKTWNVRLTENALRAPEVLTINGLGDAIYSALTMSQI